MKKTLILFLSLFSCALSSKAQLDEWPKMQNLNLTEIRTSSDRVLVAYFLGPDVNDVSTTSRSWSLNGKRPAKIEKWVTPNWSAVEFGYEHHIYLTMDEPMVQGKEYVLKTPHGDKTFTFDSKEIFCESIKTNQSAYSALSKVRYANFAIWTGTGGGGKIVGDLPKYEVFEISTGKPITQGTMAALGESESSGDFVYRIDLSGVPEGGPYMVEVKGYGRSYPFGVGGAFSQKLSYISFRGLLHERCGLEQKQPYFDHDIREICHPTVYVTDSPPREARVVISPSDPIIKTHGGYHDAGDADRRDHHMIAPMVLLTYYDMFPNKFFDLQYNIPDIFDEDFKAIGQGNGIPDVIDEAEWGTAIFEILQEENGGVRSGTERTGYPSDAVGLDKDTDQYATFRVSHHSTTLAAGLFAHLARLMKPYNSDRAVELQKRAEKAWEFAADSALIGHKFYYLTQYYLLTGDEATHKELAQLAPEVSLYETNHEGNPRRIHDTDVLLGAHFFSYLLQNDRPKNPTIVKIFQDVIKKVADRRVNELDANIWPNGTAEPNRWWGSQTAQGQYADPLLMQWRLTGEQKYVDAASQLMDYNQGLNPIGKSFLSGTGFDRVEDPLHHDSYPMKLKGWGPAPGLQVFGPGNLGQLKERVPVMIPDIKTVAPQRQWLDSRRNVSGNEFTVPESITYPAVVYTVLSSGGAWDRKSDPFMTINKSDRIPVEGGIVSIESKEVNVDSFEICKYETTNAEYATFLNAIKVGDQGMHHEIQIINVSSPDLQIEFKDGKWISKSGKENHPMVMVSYFGAIEYCNWLGGKLPTVAEWTWAAKGGKESRNYIYAGGNSLDEVGWYRGNCKGSSHEVGLLAPNELGIYDMSGNAWEWCLNEDLDKGETFTLHMGGSWYPGEAESRISARFGNTPDHFSNSVGFRVIFPESK